MSMASSWGWPRPLMKEHYFYKNSCGASHDRDIIGFKISFNVPVTPLCWKSNNPRVRAPWRNYLPYESMAKSKCFWQNRSDLTLWPFLQINPEKMTSLQMCRIKKITPCSIQTFWDRQLCFYVKKLFVSEKTQKSELFHFS